MNRIYSATYSNVPVYEYNVASNHVMRRRSDHWINATHILKVADFDKPARTRILEREVQKGTHEKVQGGYGKYQGTWIPLEDGRELAERVGCLEKLRPILDFVPGDRSPPPAPKHATASSARPKAPRASAQAQNTQPPPRAKASQIAFDTFSDPVTYERQSPEDDRASMTASSSSEMIGNTYHPAGSRKRKRDVPQPATATISREEQENIMWADELLDFFALQSSEDPPLHPPPPPASIDWERAIDDAGHKPLHWAAAMAHIKLIQEFIQRGAKVDSLNLSGETPLIRATHFTNNWDSQMMPRLVSLLYTTVGQRDRYGATVFHHIAQSTIAKSKYGSARYYLSCILDKLKEQYNSNQITPLLNVQDYSGDTAIIIAARNGARKCVRLLAEAGASTEIANSKGETAGQYIQLLNERRRERHNSNRAASSSPVQAPNNGFAALDASTAQGLGSHATVSRTASGKYNSEAAALLASQLPTLIASRTEALARALEAELATRESEAKEAERVLEQRRHELEILKRRTSALASKETEVSERAAPQIAEVDKLTAEHIRAMRRSQAREIQNLVSEAGSEDANLLNGHDSPEDVIVLARQVQEAQQSHYGIISEIVRCQSLSGMGGEKGEAYKRLITGALNVKSEDVEALLPDILQELEDRITVAESPLDVKAAVMDGHTSMDVDANGSVDHRVVYGGAPGAGPVHVVG